MFPVQTAGRSFLSQNVRRQPEIPCTRLDQTCSDTDITRDPTDTVQNCVLPTSSRHLQASSSPLSRSNCKARKSAPPRTLLPLAITTAPRRTATVPTTQQRRRRRSGSRRSEAQNEPPVPLAAGRKNSSHSPSPPSTIGRPLELLEEESGKPCSPGAAFQLRQKGGSEQLCPNYALGCSEGMERRRRSRARAASSRPSTGPEPLARGSTHPSMVAPDARFGRRHRRFLPHLRPAERPTSSVPP